MCPQKKPEPANPNVRENKKAEKPKSDIDDFFGGGDAKKKVHDEKKADLTPTVDAHAPKNMLPGKGRFNYLWEERGSRF